VPVQRGGQLEDGSEDSRDQRHNGILIPSVPAQPRAVRSSGIAASDQRPSGPASSPNSGSVTYRPRLGPAAPRSTRRGRRGPPPGRAWMSAPPVISGPAPDPASPFEP